MTPQDIISWIELWDRTRLTFLYERSEMRTTGPTKSSYISDLRASTEATEHKTEETNHRVFFLDRAVLLKIEKDLSIIIDEKHQERIRLKERHRRAKEKLGDGTLLKTKYYNMKKSPTSCPPRLSTLYSFFSAPAVAEFSGMTPPAPLPKVDLATVFAASALSP